MIPRQPALVLGDQGWGATRQVGTAELAAEIVLILPREKKNEVTHHCYNIKLLVKGGDI